MARQPEQESQNPECLGGTQTQPVPACQGRDTATTPGCSQSPSPALLEELWALGICTSIAWEPSPFQAGQSHLCQPFPGSVPPSGCLCASPEVSPCCHRATEWAEPGSAPSFPCFPRIPGFPEPCPRGRSGSWHRSYSALLLQDRFYCKPCEYRYFCGGGRSPAGKPRAGCTETNSFNEKGKGAEEEKISSGEGQNELTHPGATAGTGGMGQEGRDQQGQTPERGSLLGFLIFGVIFTKFYSFWGDFHEILFILG